MKRIKYKLLLIIYTDVNRILLVLSQSRIEDLRFLKVVFRNLKTLSNGHLMMNRLYLHRYLIGAYIRKLILNLNSNLL